MRSSPEFDRLWRDNDVVAHGERLKGIHHPELGLLELEVSAFAVDGRPELGLIVYNPTTADAADLIRRHVETFGEIERRRRRRWFAKRNQCTPRTPSIESATGEGAVR